MFEMAHMIYVLLVVPQRLKMGAVFYIIFYPKNVF